MRKLRLSLLFLLSTLTSSLFATLRMQPLFADGMVLQQRSQAPLWGEATPGATVCVTTSWNGQTCSTVADAQGRWMLRVLTPSAGGPYELTIEEKADTQRHHTNPQRLILHDVLIGEVWLCSGQSNMDMPVAGWGKVNDYERECAEARYPQLRFLHIDYTMSPSPQRDVRVRDGGWQACTPQTVARFSAAAYFFGRDILQSQHVPVGLIMSTWSGTPAEAWVSADGLSRLPDFTAAVGRISRLPVDATQRRACYDRELTEWNRLLQSDTLAWSQGTLRYALPTYDDSAWDEATVPGYTTGPDYDSFDGILWYRTVVDIPTAWAGKELTLDLGRIDDNDLTFWNGTVIGHTDGYAEHRIYKVPAQLVTAGRAVITVRDLDIGGRAGLPDTIRLEGQPLTTTWKVRRAQILHQLPVQPRNPLTDAKNVCMLYNAMIHPLVPYALRGFLWYQGEDNANRAYQYRELLPCLIDDWRNAWGAPLPFYIAQLANYQEEKDQPAESKWAELREAQQLTASHLPQCATACLIDTGTADDIHPKDKQTAGQRLALLARALTYGDNIEYSGPRYNGHTVEGRALRLHFTHADSLHITADSRTFALAGPDHQYHWADARIDGTDVVLTSPEVTLPVAARYNWADNPTGCLYNRQGLPAHPFRTDDWPGLTYLNTDY